MFLTRCDAHDSYRLNPRCPSCFSPSPLPHAAAFPLSSRVFLRHLSRPLSSSPSVLALSLILFSCASRLPLLPWMAFGYSKSSSRAGVRLQTPTFYGWFYSVTVWPPGINLNSDLAIYSSRSGSHLVASAPPFCLFHLLHTRTHTPRHSFVFSFIVVDSRSVVSRKYSLLK